MSIAFVRAMGRALSACRRGVSETSTFAAPLKTATRGLRLATGVAAAATTLVMMMPATASAQSAGCTAINSGALDFRAVYVDGALDPAQSTARFENTVTNRAIHAIRTVAGTTDPEAGTAAYLDGGTLYPFAAGDQIDLTMTVSNFSTAQANGQISGAFRNGSSSTATSQAGTANFTANGTVPRQYTVTGAETSIGLIANRTNATTNGTIDFAVTCTPATPPAPTINSIAPTGGSSGGGTPVTITGTNFVNASTYTAMFGPSTVPATFASATTLTATTPAGNGPTQVTVTDTTTSQAATGSATFTYAAPTVTALSATSGPANQARAVTITGTNFTPSATVSIDGAAATNVAFVSATQLNATLPARPAGTYSVRVTTGSVTTAANPPADQYTYIAAPTIASLTPNSGTTAGGTSVTITGSSLANATAVTFGGTAAQSYVINTATQITAVTPARTAGAVPVAVTTPGGTATLAGGYTYVVLNPPAVATQPADQTVAVGATATFSASASGSPQPTVQWQISTAGGGTFADIPGATSTSHTTPPTVASDNGNRYRAVFTNSQGAATSSEALLAVVQAPTANAQSVTVPFNTRTPITLTGTDPNSPPRALTYELRRGPANGVLFGTAPNVEYRPNTNVRGEDSITFVVGNGVATSEVATVSITIADPTLTITNTPPAGQRNVAYDFQFTTTGGTGSYTYSVTAGALPAGLALSDAGRVTGTPAASGSFPVTVTVTDAALGAPPVTGSQDFTFAIAAPTLTASPPPGPLPGATVGIAYAVNFTTSGGTAPYGYTLAGGSLPAGMTLDASTGRFSGTPTQAGGYDFSVTATDSSTPGSGGPYTLTVAYSGNVQAPTIAVAPPSIQQPQVGAAYSAALGATGGTAPYTFSVSAGALPAGLALAPNGTLSGTPTQGGAYDFTIAATDSSTGTGAPFSGTLRYTGTVSAPAIAIAPSTLPPATGGQPYSQTLTASGGTAPYSFAVTSGALPTGVTLSPAGVLAGTPTVQGSFPFTVTATDSSTGGPNPGGRHTGSVAYTLSVGAPSIVIAPETLPAGTVAAAYSQVLTASGGTGAYTFTLATGALPAGLTLAADGTLSGTPTAGGAFSFTVQAADGNGFTGTRAYPLAIGAPTIALAPSTLPDATRNVAYSQAFTASGGTAPYGFAVTAGSLPTGLTLSADGTLSGTPTVGGTFDFTVTATDASTGTGPYSGSLAYSLTVVVPDIQITPATLAQGTTRVPYSQALTAAGGAAPYGFAVTAGALPAGITLSVDGTLAGTTTQSGTFSFTATATDVNGNTGSRPYDLVIAAPTITIAPATLPAGTAGSPYGQSLTASGGVAPYVFTVTAGALPAGITLAADGTLSGTTTETGSFGFTATATDANGNTGEQVYSLVFDAPVIALAPATLPDGTGSVSYLQTLTASGGVGPYAFAAAGTLPPGLTLAADGTLSGTPTQGGSFAFTVTATDANGFTGSADYTVLIDAPAVAIAPATLPDGTGSVAYLETLTASGGLGPYAFAATGTLPPGLTFAVEGTLSGTPTQGGSFAFTVSATDANGFTGSADYTVRIGAPAIVLAPGALPAATVGSPYGQAVTASGGAAPYGFALASGTLPPGLALGADGVLSGTPTAGGSFEIVVQASDVNGFTGTAAYTLRVDGGLPTAADTTVTVLAGTSLTVDLTAGATGGPFTGAALVSQPDPRIGTATLDRGGEGTLLVFAADPAGAGRTSVAFTLSNAFGPSNVATLTVLVEARPDPALDPEVVGLLGAQADSTRRVARAQIRNFRDRLERTHDEDERQRGSANISIGLPSESSANDPIALFEERGEIALDERFATLDPASGGRVPRNPREPAVTPNFERPRSNAAFWAGGFVNFGSRDLDEVSIDLDRTLVGLSAGVDYRFTPQFVGGIGIGYGRERADIGENGTTSRGEAYSGVLYGSFAPGANLFLDGLVGYSRLQFDSRRHVTATGEMARGERSGDQVFGSLTATWEHRGPAHLFAPYFGVEGSHARLDAFTEAGASPFTLTYGRQDVSSLAGILGLRMESEFAFDWGVLTPRARIEYAHDFAQSDRASIGYADVGTLAYGVRTDVEGRDRLEFGLGFDAAFIDGWTLALDYRPALGLSGGQRDHSIAVQVTKPF